MESNKFFLIILNLIFLLIVNGNVYTQESISNVNKENDNFRINMTRARMRYSENDFNGALRIYKELYTNNANNAILNYRMGECCVKLLEMTEAIKCLTKAIQVDSLIDPKAYMLLGQALAYEGRIDEAIDSYSRYKMKLTPKQLETDEVDFYLKQALTAQELIKKTVNVKITNLGENINSQYTDANPSITADQQTLIFTSRRPETTGNKIEDSNNEYFEDIYISKWNKDTKSWSKAVPVPGEINTRGHDANTSISPDGKIIFIYRNLTGATRSGDMLFSEIDVSGNWGKPQPLSKLINSTYFESSACISADGNTLYFVSERIKDGYGQGDIYLCRKVGNIWSEPENLGPIINTPYDEIGVFIHPDGKTLFFSSNGHNTMGCHDIFMSEYKNGRWTQPVNLGYPINTTKEEIHFVLTTDGKTAYISSSRSDGYGKTDIYEIDMRNYKETFDQRAASVLSDNDEELAILKGIITDLDTENPIKTEITLKDITTNGVVCKIMSNDKGEYFITLPSDKKYELIIDTPQYQSYSYKFKFAKKKDEISTLKKDISLQKK